MAHPGSADRAGPHESRQERIVLATNYARARLRRLTVGTEKPILARRAMRHRVAALRPEESPASPPWAQEALSDFRGSCNVLSFGGYSIFRNMECAMELKPQDLFVLYKLAANPGRPWTYATMGAALGMSPSQVHRSVQRATFAGLAQSKDRREWHVLPEALLEFSVHGARYAFPAALGPVGRGVPTSFGALPLSAEINSAPGEAPVWPYPEGEARGPSLNPLCHQVPKSALADRALYELLSLVDAMRVGRSRERTLSQRLLSDRLSQSHASR